MGASASTVRTRGAAIPAVDDSALAKRAIRGPSDGRARSGAASIVTSLVPADRRSRSETLFQVTRGEQIVLERRMAPHAREAVGLQLHADRERILEVGALLLRAAHLLVDPEDVLHVVPELVRDDVRLCEVARCPEPARELVEEAQVEVDALVGRAVERADRRRSIATRGGDRIAEHRKASFAILVPKAWEQLRPGLLDVVEHERHELHALFLLAVASVALGGLVNVALAVTRRLRRRRRVELRAVRGSAGLDTRGGVAHRRGSRSGAGLFPYHGHAGVAGRSPVRTGRAGAADPRLRRNGRAPASDRPLRLGLMRGVQEIVPIDQDRHRLAP